MSTFIEQRLRAQYADFLQRALLMQNLGFYASARALFERAWSCESRLNAAGIWL